MDYRMEYLYCCTVASLHNKMFKIGVTEDIKKTINDAEPRTSFFRFSAVKSGNKALDSLHKLLSQSDEHVRDGHTDWYSTSMFLLFISSFDKIATQFSIVDDDYIKIFEEGDGIICYAKKLAKNFEQNEYEHDLVKGARELLDAHYRDDKE